MKRWKFTVEVMGAKTREDAETVRDELCQRMADYRDSGEAPLAWYVSDGEPERYEEKD